MKKNQSMREMINEMKHYSDILKEGYMDMYQDEEEIPEEEGMPEEEMPVERMGASQQIAQCDERIAKIREVCLDGLKQFSEDVNSIQYDFFKKTFLAADKVAEDMCNAGQGHEERHNA